MPEFRVYLRDKCLINPPPQDHVVTEGLVAKESLGAGLLGLFVPKLLETGIRGIANALKKAGADETVQVTATCFTDLYSG